MIAKIAIAKPVTVVHNKGDKMLDRVIRQLMSNKKEKERFEKFKEKWVLWDSIDKPIIKHDIRTKYTVRNGSYFKKKFGKK